MPTSKILVTRRLSDEVMKTLEASGVEVRTARSTEHAVDSNGLCLTCCLLALLCQIVVSPEDGAADREWILRNAPGSTGILCMLTDKVRENDCRPYRALLRRDRS
jgi:hypothetical protein